jgi:hypothetical protein
VLARALEAGGISTTSISLVREHTEKLKPPRALFVPFPFGLALGPPEEPAMQHRVLAAALELLQAPAGPVLVDFPDEAEAGGEPPAPLQASMVAAAPAAPTAEDAAAETAEMQRRHGRWLARSGGRTAVALSGVPADRLDTLVRFLDLFAANGAADMAERPADVPLPNFVRYGADDLKALYYETFLADKPGAGGAEIARWFWGETAAGALLRRVRERLDASDDPAWKAAAFGVAR